MKNLDRYKTTDERTDAFWKKYPIPMMPNEAVKAFADWLELEASSDNVLPCPFCGKPVLVVHDTNAIMEKMKWLVQCVNCPYEYGAETREKVTEIHNRVSRYVSERIDKEGK